MLSILTLLACGEHGPGGNNGPGGTNTDDTGLAGEICEPSLGDIAEAPLRRLTRTEINNSIEDLTGYDGAPADRLPTDATVLGFDNSAHRGNVSTLEADGYLRVAEEVSAAMLDRLEDYLPCDPTGDERGCAEAFIDDFGSQVYRRPLDDTEAGILLDLYDIGADGETFEDGVELVIQALFQSPQFIYQVETDGVATDEAGIEQASSYEMASRLSFFLWDSMPDAELLAAAEAGELSTVEQVRAQAERMLDSDRARAAQAHFYAQWTDITHLDDAERDDEVWSEDLAAMMAEEQARFVEDVLWNGDGTLTSLLTSEGSMLNASLADLYGVSGPSSDTDWQWVTLDGAERAGILTQPALLAALAHENQTSPVHRGLFIRNKLLCQELSDPPDELDISLPTVDDTMTTRERFARHMQDDECSVCHIMMDPVGFGFEHYDNLGRWRDTENDLPVDATGFVVVAEGFDDGGTFYGAPELAARLAESSDVHACMVTQTWRYALAREEGEADACALESLTDSFVGSGLDLRQLLVQMTVEDSFRYRRVAQ